MTLTRYLATFGILNLLTHYPATGKENVIFEQIGQLAGSTSYLHVHVTISLSSIKEQINAFRGTLEKHFKDEETIQQYVTEANNKSNITNAQILSNVLPYVATQWVQIAKLHLRELPELEAHIQSLYNILPDYPDSEVDKNRIHTKTSTTEPPENFDPYYQKPRNRRPNKLPPITTQKPVTEHLGRLIHPVTESVILHIPLSKSPNYTSHEIWDNDDYPNDPYRRKRFAGVVALPLAIAATAMGIYNSVQIEFLKSELTQVQENGRRLFEVVSTHDKEIKDIHTALRQLGDLMAGILSINPALLDVRLTRIENQIKDRLRLATHAIQTGQHRRLAVDYLSPSAIRALFTRLQTRSHEFGCDLLLEHHSDLFQIEVSVLFDGEDVHLLLHVPMVPQNTLLRLFKLHPFPLPFFSEHFLIPEVQNDILAVSSNDHRFSVQLSSVDLLGCHRMNQVFMCSKFAVLSRQFNQTCLGALFNQDFTNAQSICKFQIVPVCEKVLQLKNNWFVSYMIQASTIPIRCHNGTVSEIHLGKGSQKFHLSPGCKANFLDHSVTADLSIQMPNEIVHYEWDWEPLNLIHLPELNISHKLQTLQEFGLHRPSLTDLQYLAHQYNDQRPSTIAHWFHSAANITLVVLILIIVIFLAYRFYQWRQRRHSGPATPTGISPTDSGSEALLKAHAAAILLSHTSAIPANHHRRSTPNLANAPPSVPDVRYSSYDQQAYINPHDPVRTQVNYEQERQSLIDRLTELEGTSPGLLFGKK